MLIVTKKNRQLRIPDEKKDTYIALGYTVKDEKGNVISEPEDAEKKAEELAAEIEALKAEIAALKSGQSEEEEAAAAKTAAAKKKTSAKAAE